MHNSSSVGDVLYFLYPKKSEENWNPSSQHSGMEEIAHFDENKYNIQNGHDNKLI